MYVHTTLQNKKDHMHVIVKDPVCSPCQNVMDDGNTKINQHALYKCHISLHNVEDGH